MFTLTGAPSFKQIAMAFFEIDNCLSIKEMVKLMSGACDASYLQTAKCLSRLCHEGLIQRVSHGIYKLAEKP